MGKIIKFNLFMLGLFCFVSAIACTSFGLIASDSVVLAKNRDFYYASQELKVVMPNRQFISWYGNNYDHQYKIFALLSNDDIKMGFNQMGLSAIEEDVPLPSGANSNSREYLQPENGYSEGMILRGILQNFATIDEIIPYIPRIFATAAPNFYQIADGSKILEIEVSIAKSSLDESRPYTYKILDKKSQLITHTNHYLSTEFQELNITPMTLPMSGSVNRRNRINDLLSHESDVSIDAYKNLFFDTKSDVVNPNDTHFCQHTSILRTDIRGMKFVSTSDNKDNLAGSVSSMIIINYGDVAKDMVYFKIIDNITTLRNGDQEISYREVTQNLASLFISPIRYTNKKFLRKSPVNNVCK